MARLKRGGVFLGEYCAETEGEPRRETVGRGVRRLDRGVCPRTEAGGDDICMALTDDGERKGGRGVPRTVATKSWSSMSEGGMSEMRGEWLRCVMFRRESVCSILVCSASDMEPMELRGLSSLKTSSSCSWWELLSPASGASSASSTSSSLWSSSLS